MVPVNREHVVLLHGLCRTRRCMRPMERALRDAGFAVDNAGYDSRSAPIETLSRRVTSEALARCRADGATLIHFVAHSLGGILIRCAFRATAPPDLGRVVMLGPPNHGSEVVDRFRKIPIFGWLNGPAGYQLGTGPDSVPNQLGRPSFPVGIIAGNRSINWINSLFIAGPDDGKVSVERTKIEGMTEHIVVPVPHPFLMRSKRCIRQTIAFLRHGKFARDAESPRDQG